VGFTLYGDQAVSDFPVDDLTLRLLAEACQINPDTGQTHLHDFLDMGTVVKAVTDETTGETHPDAATALQETPDDVPVFFVEYEEGYEPHSETGVILALIAEIQRLRGEEASLIAAISEVAEWSRYIDFRDVPPKARALILASPDSYSASRPDA
jgi:hypothetical protein